MTSRKVLAVVVACIAVVGLAVAAYVLQSLGEARDVDVEGGAIIEHSGDRLTVRCLSPDLKINTADFTGNITISNCFPGSILEGYDGSALWNGTVLSFAVSSRNEEYRLVAPEKDDFSFAVMGDSQGHNDILEEALNMTEGCDFVIHCGDLTPSGSATEFVAVEETLNESESPVFTTPGNHDTKNYGPGEYVSRLGPTQYAFDYGGVRFAFVDSSDLNITVSQISWLKDTLEGAQRKVIVTHAPSYDPFEGNHTLDPASCERLQDFAIENDVTAVFSGHVHAYYLLNVEGTDFVITGGTGGSLTAGTYHWLRVNVTSTGFAYDKVEIDRSSTAPSALSIKGHGITQNLTLVQLLALDAIEGNSSYENQFGNVGGSGHYRGVMISVLLELVGNISDGEILRITATDGYHQEFGYGNVYPNGTWLGLQGQMIIALEYDGAQVPEWQDGPRIAMMPSDGLYSNTDCNETSYAGQGYSIYPSAGARWVKNVAEIEVVS